MVQVVNIIKDREQAFRVTDVAESIEEVVKEIERIEGQRPLIINNFC